ncbi:sarcosine oxidase subunit gamma [Primorskyibacter sp. S187A]|uniref:sarcosine oxidase subunit gamma n=1 Tax=Primorskyibacter sp. S187A TaxID=3415130 RepID=UPI003C7D191B
MSDAVSALQGAQFDGLVSLRDLGPQGMISLRADLADASVKKAVKAAIGVDVPARRQASLTDAGGALWMSPDEAMLLCAYGDVPDVLAKLQKALGSAHALAADVSDARVVIRMEGPAAREVLAKVCPADLRAEKLPVGEVRRTRFAQVAGAFWFRDDETVDVVCFRSVAGYVFDLLSTAADPQAAVGHF